ncbi:MAG: SPFH domain-containing protein [Thermodesulfobacteriota bacterium]
MKERVKTVASGYVLLPVVAATIIAAPILTVAGIFQGSVRLSVLGVIALAVAILLSKGLFTLQPNEAMVLVLFGKYAGTVKTDGFHWANPFSVKRGSWETVSGKDKEHSTTIRSRSKYKVSLRARNFETQTLKVNDQRGNPIEIGAVVVWRVRDTAMALFDVDDFEHYVQIQSETALRHLANSYPYDHSEDGAQREVTLRDDAESVGAALAKELQERLSRAGVVVEEARLTHLAYASEIAGVMLRRQQAEAIISARQKIVHGAVSMVQMALEELSAKGVVSLDESQKAAMVGNLLVVLCSETQAEPVINAGSSHRQC